MDLDVGEASELVMYSLGGTGVQAVRRERMGVRRWRRGSAPRPGSVFPQVGVGERAAKPRAARGLNGVGRKEYQEGGMVNEVKVAKKREVKVTTGMPPQMPLS